MAARRTPLVSRTTLAAVAAVPVLLLTGCSATVDDGGGGSGSDAAAPPAERAAAADSAGGSAADPASDTQTGGEVATQQVISTGDVQLRSDDVGQAVFDVRQVVDRHGGTIAEDDTETDDDGQALRSRMVLRIPTAEFDAAVDALEEAADLVASHRQTSDVTTEVLDIDVRVEAQQRSIDRIQVLFDNASSIKDVVNVESELARRQADLASLQAQQRYLADQTSMSTVTVSVERTRAGDEADDDSGFLAGLGGGWDALTSFLGGAATVAGALLPWVALLAVLAAVGWPVVRGLRRHARRGRTATGTGAA